MNFYFREEPDSYPVTMESCAAPLHGVEIGVGGHYVCVDKDNMMDLYLTVWDGMSQKQKEAALLHHIKMSNSPEDPSSSSD